MGFTEQVNRQIDEMLAQRIEDAEQRLGSIDGEKQHCVDEAAKTKLELMILRRKQNDIEITQRLTKESDLKTRIHEKEQQYNELDAEEDSLRDDLQVFQSIMAEVRQNSLQPA